ncbi:Nse1 non-SMC component of SMC5-6 complex-domain-containing protein [Exophiala viscosa]|uniref:Non-structural maintenance of chromosomes element 1 homolog n=1 Tax=Exophiala viscosa TaxID=2486360 RepID=A0AAN6E7M2_9EURO|nr:Nse1 non-SMC component of SMC5-6 complex-domain-containing protein [Exophiala viscosa]KAI1627825.1 Nse1 non-SMC component of SMC5-6 complex-domain-containing protein [Exophiala viscosa]
MADVGPVHGYSNANRAFLQAFLAQSVLTLETARPILAAILTYRDGRDVEPQDVTADDFNVYIAEANRRLSPLDLEIRSTFHQQTRERVYALVNTTSDSLTQLATTYSADEIVYLKKLLDAMFDGQNNKGKREAMCLSGIEAIQVGRSQSRRETQNGNATQSTAGMLAARDAEAMLTKLLEEGWLEKSRQGFYSLSPRALMELKGWLIDTYNDEDEDGEKREKIKFCHACKEIVTVGQRCPRRECPCRLHDICTQNFFRVQRSQTCPICKTEWDGQHYVGEKAITTSDSYQNGRRKSGHRHRTDAATEANAEEGT